MESVRRFESVRGTFGDLRAWGFVRRGWAVKAFAGLAALGGALLLAGLLTAGEARAADGGSPRFRFGADLGPNAGYGADRGWIGGSLHLRLGLQATESLAFDYQALGVAAVSPRIICLNLSGGGCKDPTFYQHTSSLMAAAVLADRFVLSAGPSIAVDLNQVQADVSLRPGFSVRLAVVWGHLTPPPRYGFALGVQGDVVFGGLSVFTTTVGFEYY